MTEVLNALTIDVEDYFHCSYFQSQGSVSDWDRYESRVVDNVERTLRVLAEERVTATFFVLGWVAERYPDTIWKIKRAGHEVGTHGYAHQLAYRLTPEAFLDDLRRSVKLIEGITGEKVLGHRAASFSIVEASLWAVPLLKQEGLQYDSSIFPTAHDYYGIPSANRAPFQFPHGLWEFPMTVFDLFGRSWPVGGGGYLRLYPYWLTRWAIRKVNGEGRPAVVYLHPWETDPRLPHIPSSLRTRFRHRVNLGKTVQRLRLLCRDFSFGPLRTILSLYDSPKETPAT